MRKRKRAEGDSQNRSERAAGSRDWGLVVVVAHAAEYSTTIEDFFDPQLAALEQL